ncbi:BON domain-containing protein [Burkholderia ubonensis]|uniref:BON domain-containing protein n=2 Tax=Burkholderia ubonensis TaxID=101571 RepID=UPI002FC37142
MMQKRYPGRPTDRRGPQNWQERNERAYWGAGERDEPNYDESLVPEDEYESACRFASEPTDQEGWGREWDDRADRVPPAPGRRANGADGYDGHPYLPRFGGPGIERGVPRWRRGPKGYTRSDERIREDVCERLARALGIDVSDVSVKVQDGRVELDGTVPARWMRHGIEDIADSCLYVRDVENHVKVRRVEDDTRPQVLRPDQRTVTLSLQPRRQEPDGARSERKTRR